MTTRDPMATAEEIERRVAQADRHRLTLRVDAAKKVHRLAAEQDALDRKLAAAVVDACKVMTPEELAAFTRRNQADIERWARIGGLKLTRRRRKTRTETTGAARRSPLPAQAHDNAPSPASHHQQEPM